MSYDNAIKALSNDALKYIKDYSIIGLGSGRAATALVKSLSKLIEVKGFHVVGIPTSLQIKQVAEKGGIPLVEADQVDHIDVVFDGADQIDSQKFVIKGGGGALLRENILFNLAKKVVVMADKTKFVKNFTRTVPVEVHPLARNSVTNSIAKLGGKAAKLSYRPRDASRPFGGGRPISRPGFGGVPFDGCPEPKLAPVEADRVFRGHCRCQGRRGAAILRALRLSRVSEPAAPSLFADGDHRQTVQGMTVPRRGRR